MYKVRFNWLASQRRIILSSTAPASFSTQRMENITEVYRKIRDLTIDLVDAVEDACMTRPNFKSSEVSNQLDKLIDLVIRVSEKLCTYYAKKGTISFNASVRGISRCRIPEKTFKDLLWIRNENPDVEGLSQELVRLKARIQYAYLNEMQSGIVHMQEDLTKMLVKVSYEKITFRFTQLLTFGFFETEAGWEIKSEILNCRGGSQTPP